jgi:hypothetical protein
MLATGLAEAFARLEYPSPTVMTTAMAAAHLIYWGLLVKRNSNLLSNCDTYFYLLYLKLNVYGTYKTEK